MILFINLLVWLKATMDIHSWDESSSFNICYRIYISLFGLQFSSVAQSCPTLCNPMNLSMSGLPVHHPLLDFFLRMLLFFNKTGLSFQFSSVQSLNHVWPFVTPWTAACQASLSITNPGVHPSPCPSSQWCHPTISFSVIPFSCPQSFPVSGSFPMSQLFASGGQSIGASALMSVLPMNTQDWSPSEWTGWISLQSKGLSRVFCGTTVWKHQFFGIQPSLWSLSHPYMTTGKTTALTIRTFVSKVVSLLFNTLSSSVIAFLPRNIF